MRKTPLLFVAGAIGACTFVASTEAHALGPLSLEVGINAGYGTNPDSGYSSLNPLGVGLGGRAGVSIFGFYGGIEGDYYIGGGQDVPVPVLGGTVHESVHTAKYGVQLGYNLGIPFITIRPQVGLGNLTITGSYDATTIGGVAVPASSASSSSFWVEPGVVGLITFGIYFIGADINALIITKYPEGTNPDGSANTPLKAALTAHGQLGLTF